MHPVAVVAKTDRVRLLADVGETDIRCIREGQKVIVNGADRSDASTGRVTKISLSANPMTGLFRVEMEADNPSELVRLGTYTTVRIEVVNDPAAVYADARALQEDQDGRSFVYVVRKDTVSRTTVEISGMNDDFVRITGGVGPEDLVVTSGFSRLEDGARVSFAQPAPQG